MSVTSPVTTLVSSDSLTFPVASVPGGVVISDRDDQLNSPVAMDEDDESDDDLGSEDEGFADGDDDGAGDSDEGFQDGLDDDEELDGFDDIDEDDFDDEFDDDFEEEQEDDYEIEIEDEISAEFGLSGSGDDEDGEIEDDLDDFEDFDNIN